jgi:MFS family permease
LILAIYNYWSRIQGLSSNAKRYLACTIFRSVSISIWWLLYNLYLTSMGFDVGFIGLANTLGLAVCIVCSLPAGLIADRIGRKRALVIGLIGMVLCRFGIATFSLGWLIIPSSMLFGIFDALFIISIAPFLMENSTVKERTVLFTLNASLMSLISFIATIGGGYLPRLFGAVLSVRSESTLAYRAAMVTAAFLYTLGLIPLLRVKEEKKPTSFLQATRFAWQIRPRFSNPKLMVKLLIPKVLFGFGAGLLFPFLNLFYKQRFGISDGTLGWIFGIMDIVVALMTLGAGAVAERQGKIWSLLIARVLATPLLLVMGFVPSLPVVAVAQWMRSGLFRLGEPLYLAFAMEQLDESERATGSSLLQMGWDIGGAAGPYVSGLVQMQFGLGPLFVSTTTLYTLSLICIYRFFGLQRETKQVLQSQPCKHA